MSTYRQDLQKLLEVNDTIKDNQPSDDAYIKWLELAKAVGNTVDGFVNVLNASKAARDAQKKYFAARRSGMDRYDLDKLLDDSKKAEKILDDLIKFWSHQMAPTPPVVQTSLF